MTLYLYNTTVKLSAPDDKTDPPIGYAFTNMPDNIPEQINGLNNLVLEYSIPKLFSEATAYLKYKHDASTLVVPLNRPVLAYSNDKTLELKPWF